LVLLTTVLFFCIEKPGKSQTDSLRAVQYFRAFSDVEFTDTAKMKVYVDSALYHARRSGSLQTQATAYRYYGWYYQDMARYSAAEKMFEISMRISRQIRDEQGMADTWANMGNLYLDSYDLISSVQAHTKSMKLNSKLYRIATSIGAKQKPLSGLSAAYSNLASLYSELDDFRKAISLQKRSIDYEKKKQSMDSTGMAISYHGLSIYYRNLGMKDSAYFYVMQAENLYKKVKYTLGTGQIQLQKGRILELFDSTERAIEYYQQAVISLSEHGAWRDVLTGRMNMLALFLKNDNQEKAEELIPNLELPEIKALGNKIRHAYFEQKAIVLFRQGIHDSAYLFLKLYTQYRDSVLNDEKKKQILTSRFSYELNERMRADSLEYSKQIEVQQLRALDAENRSAFQTRIILLSVGFMLILITVVILLFRNANIRKKLNIKLQQQSVNLESSLRERETLLKEIHHRVKNNLQIVSSLLNIQSGHVGSKPTAEILADSQNRILSMSLIHEKLYKSDTLEKIDLKNYLENLTEHLGNSFALDSKNITISVQCDDIFLDIDQTVPLGLIINELVTNSIKHAFNGLPRGTIVITATSSLNQCTVTITDDGKGMNPENKSEGLGMKLSDGLCRQLKSKLIKLNVTEGVGFTFTFALKN
jgi:two-component sensor histidine kinase